MPNGQALITLLKVHAPSGAPLISIVSQNNSARLQAVAKFIFETSLQCRFEVVPSTDKANSKFVVAYGIEATGNALLVPSSGFLEEKNIQAKAPPFAIFSSQYVLFPFENNHFDIFAAVFYFIARYEEWQTFEADEHNRFESNTSFAVKNNWPKKPWVDYWVQDLKTQLEKQFPTLALQSRAFQVISTIDVDNLYAYLGKGFIRTVGATVKDLSKFNFKGITERLAVITGLKPDPFDIYEEVSEFCFDRKIPLFYFFLMRSGTKYDRSLNPASKHFKKVIEKVKANMAFVGLHPSYNSSVDNELLLEELQMLQNAASQPVEMSRQHYLRYNQMQTPKQLLAADVKFDFTCGYASQTGFRAGTTLPFFYYDFASESSTELLSIPFCAMDGVWSEYGSRSTIQAYEELLELFKMIKQTNGLFITVFHERSFSDHLYKGFGTLYKKLHSELSSTG